MESVILFMLVAVALAAGLIAVVVMSQKKSGNLPSRSKGSPKSVSRTPSASMRASVPVQAWPLREREGRSAASRTDRDSSNTDQAEAESEPLCLAS